MTKFKTDVVYKIIKPAKGAQKETGNLYFKNVPVTYPQVHRPGKKYNSEDTAYQLGLFIDEDTKNKIEDIGVNKEFAEVGKAKIKKGSNRGKLKYPLDDVYGDYAGMYGTSFSRDTKNKKGEDRAPLKVVGPDGKSFGEDVGNGSICNVKLFTYRNEEDMLVAMLDTVVVLEHVVYEGGNSNFDEELGISIESATTPEVSEEDSTPQESPQQEVSFDDDIPF